MTTTRQPPPASSLRLAAPVAAGLAIVAADTGRVLMLQRALDDDDPASGTWEFPGGHIDDGEDSGDAAQREWEEETGHPLPDGEVISRWSSANGVYHGFVYRVATEDDVPIAADRDDVTNPDDPDGDHVEALAWWDIDHLADNPALRAELRDGLDRVLRALGAIEKAMLTAAQRAGLTALRLARTYLAPGEVAPQGYTEQQGERGGRFYDTQPQAAAQEPVAAPAPGIVSALPGPTAVRDMARDGARLFEAVGIGDLDMDASRLKAELASRLGAKLEAAMPEWSHDDWSSAADRTAGGGREYEHEHERGGAKIAHLFTKTWADSSSDSRSLSLLLQHHVSEAFGTPTLEAAGMTATQHGLIALEALRERLPQIDALARAYVDAVYADTQALLARAGLTEITVARGMGFDEPPDWMESEGPALGTTQEDIERIEREAEQQENRDFLERVVGEKGELPLTMGAGDTEGEGVTGHFESSALPVYVDFIPDDGTAPLRMTPDMARRAFALGNEVPRTPEALAHMPPVWGLKFSLHPDPTNITGARWMVDGHGDYTFREARDAYASALESERMRDRRERWNALASAGGTAISRETALLNPASSFTTRQRIATMFATGQGNAIRAVAYARVPASRVFSTYGSGIGALSEREVVLLGGEYEVVIGTAGASVDPPEIDAITTYLYGQQPKQLNEAEPPRKAVVRPDADLRNADWIKHIPRNPQGRFAFGPREAGSDVRRALDDAVDLARVYLKPGEQPPSGTWERQGKRGGRYYDTDEAQRAGHAPPRSRYKVTETAFPVEPGVMPSSRGGYDEADAPRVLALRPTLTQAEDEIRTQKHETSIAFTLDGRVIARKEGKAGNVSFTSDEIPRYRDTVFIHNHPNETRGLSAADLIMAATCDVAAMRVVTPSGRRIEVRRPGPHGSEGRTGWASPATLAFMLKGAQKSALASLRASVRSGRMTLEEANRKFELSDVEYLASRGLCEFEILDEGATAGAVPFETPGKREPDAEAAAARRAERAAAERAAADARAAAFVPLTDEELAPSDAMRRRIAAWENAQRGGR